MLQKLESVKKKILSTVKTLIEITVFSVAVIIRCGSATRKWV